MPTCKEVRARAGRGGAFLLFLESLLLLAAKVGFGNTTPTIRQIGDAAAVAQPSPSDSAQAGESGRFQGESGRF